MTLPATWKTYKLGELARYINGRAFKPEDWGSSGLPIVRIQNLNDPEKPFNYFSGPFMEKHRINSGDVLLSWSGTPGTSFGCFIWSRGEALLNQHIFNVKIRKDLVLPEYFVHATNGRLEEMIGLAHGAAGLRHITKAKLEQIELPVPPIDDQRRIIAHIKECLERVEEIEKTRQQSDIERDALVPAALEDVFAQVGAPELPLSELLDHDLQNGIYLPKEYYTKSGGTPLIRMGEMFRRFEVSAFVEKSVLVDPKVRAQFGLTEGDILVARRSIVYEGSGSMALVTSANSGSLFESSIIRMRIKPTKVLPAFVVAYFHSRAGTRKRLNITRKATISGVNQQGLLSLTIPVPSLTIQCEGLERVQLIRGISEELERLTRKPEFARLRDAILRKAFAGEL